jgi:Holliday junction resolvase RusA-like endonuclease
MMSIGRTGSSPPLVLEDSEGSFYDLVTIKTGSKYRKEITDKVKTNLWSWMQNPNFKDIRGESLDLAIVASVNPSRMKTQDIDNIAKVVLDALKKRAGDSSFLFHDDYQIVRLLIWKIQSEKRPMYNTDSLSISFRVHDNKKQMILIEPQVI